MSAHKLSTYRDENQWITYCAVCAAEGNELPTDCPNVVISPPMRKKIAENKLNFKDGIWLTTE
jgi:hypothetical protein